MRKPKSQAVPFWFPILTLLVCTLSCPAYARLSPHIGGGLSLWPVSSATLNTYIEQLATATGTTGGQLPTHSLTPHAVAGIQVDLPLGRLSADVVGLWSSQQQDNAATELQLTNWAFEIAPKWYFLSVGSWGQVFMGPTLAWVSMNGALTVAGTNHLGFSTSGQSWGGLTGLQVRVWNPMAFTLVGGYRFLGRTAPVKLTQVSGGLFEGLTVGEELELNEIGAQIRRVTLTTIGWYIQLSIGVVL